MSNDQSPEGYKKTEVGVIPESWNSIAIGELDPYITTGSRGWARYYSKFGFPFIRITNLNRESIYLNISDLKYVNLAEGVSEGKRTELHDGDILISMTADIGIIGYINHSVLKPAYINQHVSLVRLDSRKVDTKFISYFLASENVQRLFRGLTDQGAKAGLNLDAVRKLTIALPPLPEQRSIAQALSDVDALIAALDKAIAKKRAIKTATMQQLLTGKKRLPGFGEGKGYKESEIGLVPEDWDIATFGKLYAEPSRNGIYKTAEYQGRGTRIVNMGEMFGLDFISNQDMNRILLTTKEIAINRLLDGDLLFGRRSVVPAGAGKCSIVITCGGTAAIPLATGI
jgi:type I restriction enzyme S subunit